MQIVRSAGDVKDRADLPWLEARDQSAGRFQLHALAWSYDLLDDAEQTLLDRCSVFAGGFDLQSACAVGGSDDGDDYGVLDLGPGRTARTVRVGVLPVRADSIGVAGARANVETLAGRKSTGAASPTSTTARRGE